MQKGRNFNALAVVVASLLHYAIETMYSQNTRIVNLSKYRLVIEWCKMMYDASRDT